MVVRLVNHLSKNSTAKNMLKSLAFVPVMEAKGEVAVV